MVDTGSIRELVALARDAEPLGREVEALESKAKERLRAADEARRRVAGEVAAFLKAEVGPRRAKLRRAREARNALIAQHVPRQQVTREANAAARVSRLGRLIRDEEGIIGQVEAFIAGEREVAYIDRRIEVEKAKAADSALPKVERDRARERIDGLKAARRRASSRKPGRELAEKISRARERVALLREERREAEAELELASAAIRATLELLEGATPATPEPLEGAEPGQAAE